MLLLSFFFFSWGGGVQWTFLCEDLYDVEIMAFRVGLEFTQAKAGLHRPRQTHADPGKEGSKRGTHVQNIAA